MNLAMLEKQSQRLADALSGMDDALTDLQMESVPSPSSADIQRRRLLAEIDSDLSELDQGVVGIGEKVEQLKSLDGIL